MKLKLWFKNFQQTKIQDQTTSQANSIKQLYTNKLDNQEEVNKVLETIFQD